MGITFTQTDAAANCGEDVMCSGANLIDGGGMTSTAVDGGTPGNTEQTVQNSAGQTNIASCFVQMAPPTDTVWDAGDWTVRLDVTTGNTNITWQDAYICHIDSACNSLGTMGSVTGLGITLSAGVHSATVTQPSSVTPSAGDEIFIVHVFDFGGQHANTSCGITPSQDIDSPIGLEFTVSVTEVVGTTGVVEPFPDGRLAREATAFDWDHQQTELGTVHENTADTDYTDGGNIQKGYPTASPSFVDTYPQSANLRYLYLFQHLNGANTIHNFGQASLNEAAKSGLTLVTGPLGYDATQWNGVDEYVDSEDTNEGDYTDWTLIVVNTPTVIPQSTESGDLVSSNGTGGGSIDFRYLTTPELEVGGGSGIGSHLIYDISGWTAGEYHFTAWRQDNSADIRELFVDTGGTPTSTASGLNFNSFSISGGLSFGARFGSNMTTGAHAAVEIAFLGLWDVHLTGSEIQDVYDAMFGTSTYWSDKQ